MGYYFKRTLNFLTGFLNHLLVQPQHIPLGYTVFGFQTHNYTQESNLKNSVSIPRQPTTPSVIRHLSLPQISGETQVQVYLENDTELGYSQKTKLIVLYVFI